AQSVELWHLAQYWSKNFHSGGSPPACAASAGALVGAGFAAGAGVAEPADVGLSAANAGAANALSVRPSATAIAAGMCPTFFIESPLPLTMLMSFKRSCPARARGPTGRDTHSSGTAWSPPTSRRTRPSAAGRECRRYPDLYAA